MHVSCDNCGNIIDTFRDTYHEGYDDFFGTYYLCVDCDGLSIFYGMGNDYKKPLTDEDEE